MRQAADFLVAHGPSFGVERWEEQSGYSPSTIAAEIAGLAAAGEIAARHGDDARARAVPGHRRRLPRNIKGWTVTTTGPDGKRYFIRLSKNGDPDAAITYGLGNGGPTEDQRRVLDAGFLELARLGDAARGRSGRDRLAADRGQGHRRRDAHRPGWYRYGSGTPGTEDGYGDCHVGDPTACEPDGKPWPSGPNAGSGTCGRCCPVSGPSTTCQVRRHAIGRGAAHLDEPATPPAGLVPEQAWEDPDLPASPYGSDPATASIGFTNGAAAGSASPLTWAQAQVVRLALDVGAGRTAGAADGRTRPVLPCAGHDPADDHRAGRRRVGPRHDGEVTGHDRARRPGRRSPRRAPTWAATRRSPRRGRARTGRSRPRCR